MMAESIGVTPAGWACDRLEGIILTYVTHPRKRVTSNAITSPSHPMKEKE